MLKSPLARRFVAAMLVALGALMMFLATQARVGVVLLVMGVVLEMSAWC